MPITDWQVWADSVNKKLASFDARLLALEGPIVPEWRQRLIDIRVVVEALSGVVEMQSEQVAGLTKAVSDLTLAIGDEAKLAELKAKLATSQQALQQAIDTQGSS